MQIIADLQIHSKYAQAVSKYMELETIALWAKKKGINLVTTGDWTHPRWFLDIQEKLVEENEGVYKLKQNDNGVHFLLVTEVSLQYYQGSKYRAVHILIFAPSIEAVQKINKEFEKRGIDLSFDGRPPMKLSCEELVEIVLSIDEKCLIIPAHSWTPWFGFYGAHGGFNSIDEAFGKYAKNIYAVETGLGSDPAMNWRIKELDQRSIVSFSDAHSLPKLGREASVFEVPELTFENIREAIINVPVISNLSEISQIEVSHNARNDIKNKIAYTIEFYRQEGKYFATGHRKCNVSFLPEDTPENYRCPVCGKKLTVGAMQRTEDLAASRENVEYRLENGVRWVYSKDQKWRSPFVNLIPLQEILSEVYNVGVQSKKVQTEYERLTNIASEFDILLNKKLEEIEALGGSRLKEAIERNRKGEVEVIPGFDGIFGQVHVWPKNQKIEIKDQQELF